MDYYPENFQRANVLLDEMAKHQFFKNVVGNQLFGIFYERIFKGNASPSYHFDTRYAATGEKIALEARVDQEQPTPVIMSKASTDKKEIAATKRKKKRHKPGRKDKERPDATTQVSEEVLESGGTLSDEGEQPIELSTVREGVAGNSRDPGPSTADVVPTESIQEREPSTTPDEPAESTREPEPSATDDEPAECARDPEPSATDDEPAECARDPEPSAKYDAPAESVREPELNTASNAIPVLMSETHILRQTRQHISEVLKRIIDWNNRKRFQYPETSPLFLHYKNLDDKLQDYLNITHIIRNKLKGKNLNGIKFASSAPDISEENIVELLNYYTSLLDKLLEYSPNEEITQLTKQLTLLNYLTLLQPELHQRLKLPEQMPIVDHLASLFTEHAEVLVYGTALFFEHPLDIDMRLIWKNSDLAIDTIKEIFVNVMQRAGLNVSLVKDMMGSASFKLNAKNDGFGIHDHKEIDITVWVANPALRLLQLNHCSHSSATLNATTGQIDCAPQFAENIIQGIFSTVPYHTEDPISAYNIKVHILNTVMRAWAEAEKNQLILDENSQLLIEQIAKHGGNWKTLEQEDRQQKNALIGLISRHLNHYQPSNTYTLRTELFFRFLKRLQINSVTLPYVKSDPEALLHLCQHYNFELNITRLQVRPDDRLRFFNDPYTPVGSARGPVVFNASYGFNLT